MPSEIEKCIGYLRDNTDQKTAFFSFTTDESGENGVIKANREGLRLYALELLKKSQELEQNPGTQEVLFFDEYEWLEDDAGYNLIWGVQPAGDRKISESKYKQGKNAGEDLSPVATTKYRPINGWISYPAVISGMLVIATLAFKWFH